MKKARPHPGPLPLGEGETSPATKPLFVHVVVYLTDSSVYVDGASVATGSGVSYWLRRSVRSPGFGVLKRICPFKC